MFATHLRSLHLKNTFTIRIREKCLKNTLFVLSTHQSYERTRNHIQFFKTIYVIPRIYPTSSENHIPCVLNAYKVHMMTEFGAI